MRGAALIPPPATATTVAAVDGTSNNGNVTRATAAAPTVGGQSRPPRPPFFERSKEHFPARFPSWDEFDAFLGELCTATYQVFRKRSSVTAATHNRVFVAHSQKKIPPKFEFYSKRYQCTHGIPRRSRGVGMRNHAGVRDTGCTANVSAAVKLDRRIGAHFIQVQVMGAHNHPIGREQYLGYVENRKITDPALLRVIETMNALGKPPKDILAQVVAIVQKRTGEKCLYLYRDIVNALTRLKKDREQGVNLEGGEDPSGAAEEQSSAEDASPDSETDSTDALGSSRGRKRRAVGTVFTSAVSAEDDADTTRLYLLHKKNKQPGVKAKLSRLKVFLDSSYCYDHIHSEVSALFARGVVRYTHKQSRAPLSNFLYCQHRYYRSSTLTSLLWSCSQERYQALNTRFSSSRRPRSWMTWSLCCLDTCSLAVRVASVSTVVIKNSIQKTWVCDLVSMIQVLMSHDA